MQIIKFLLINWDSIFLIITAIGVIVTLIKKGETRILQGCLYKLVTEAERQFGGGTGELKFITVSDWIYERTPAILRYLFTQKDIQDLIDSALEAAKKKWVQNEKLKEYISGEHRE